MKRRKFIKTGLLASAIPTIGGIIYGSSIKNSNTKKDPFNLLYAPHFGMFTNHSGNDLVDQIQFMYDMGFRSFEDNGMKERSITDQKRIAKIMNKLEMTMGVFVAHKIHWDFPNLTSGDKEYQDQFVNDIKDYILNIHPRASIEFKINCNYESEVISNLSVRHAVINIIENSIKAAKNNVYVSFNISDNSPSKFEISINDDGPGIPSKIMENMGEPFISSRKESMGLGIFLANAAVQRLGGTIEMFNLKIGGALTLIKLPLPKSQQG